MKRFTLLVNLLSVFLCCNSQLTVNILVPPSGMVDKQQLWNIIATNTDPAPLTVQIQVSFSEISTGQPVFTAATGPVLINTGTMQLTATSIGPVQYNTVSSSYRIDPGPTGLLPVGTFAVCYNFLILKYNKVVQECQQVNIPPLGPLLLNQPSNGSALEEVHPIFSWLPPTPVQSLTNLRYALKLVEMLPHQSAADAVQDNLPLFVKTNLPATNFPYIQTSPVLLPGKTYAWQIIALNNLNEITRSECWSFTVTQKAATLILPKPDPSYIKLKKAGKEDGYAIYWGDLRFDYLNETTDNTWNIQVEDLYEARHISFALVLDSIKLTRGQNLVRYDAGADKRFIDKHQYLLKITNSRNEIWQLRFEYRKKD